MSEPAQASLAPASAPAPAAAPAKEQKLYFVNGFVDWMLIGGASIIAFVLLRTLYTGDRTNAVMTLGIQLMWVCNWPHFAATNYRLYHSRNNIRQYPLTALVIPWVVLAGVVASVLSPTRFGPFFILFYLLWSPYHFSGQTVGITLIYARRSGFKIGALERFFLSSFVYGTFISQSINAHMSTLPQPYYGIYSPSLGVPEWAWHFSKAWVYLAGAGLLIVLLRQCLLQRKVFAPIMLLPAAAQFVWFMPEAGATWLSFREFVPFFHSLQYMLIAWAMQMKDKLDRERIEPSAGYVTGETARWFGLNFAVGAVLFWAIPSKVLPYFGVDEYIALGAFTAGVQIHHFFVDGVIWKLKSASVSSPLMVNIEDLIQKPDPRPALAEQRA